MAILTRKGMENLLSSILDTGGLTPEMETLIEKLKADYDEREGLLQRYGESYEGEDEYYEWKAKQVEGGEWETKYNDLKRRYMDRFFHPAEPVPDDTDTTLLEQDEEKTRDYESILYGGNE